MIDFDRKSKSLCVGLMVVVMMAKLPRVEFENILHKKKCSCCHFHALLKIINVFHIWFPPVSSEYCTTIRVMQCLRCP